MASFLGTSDGIAGIVGDDAARSFGRLSDSGERGGIRALQMSTVLPGPRWLEAPLDFLSDSTTMCLFLAPMPLFWRCWWRRETLKMPPLNLLSQCCNTYNWLIFGMRTRKMPVVYPNAVGLSTAVCYLLLYPVFCDPAFWPHGGLRSGLGFRRRGHLSPDMPTTDEACSTATSPARLPFYLNFKLQYMLQVAAVLIVWLQPWVFGWPAWVIGWLGMSFDCLFFISPLFALYEVVFLDWRSADNVARLGSLGMNLMGFICSASWTLEFLMFLPDPQLAPSNILGTLLEAVVLLVRALKPRATAGAASEPAVASAPPVACCSASEVCDQRLVGRCDQQPVGSGSPPEKGGHDSCGQATKSHRQPQNASGAQ